MSYNVSQLRRDLDSNNQRRPALFLGSVHWGTSAWNFLYNSVLSFEGTKVEMAQFFNSLGPMLPCGDCRKHYAMYLQKNGAPSNTFTAFLWIRDLEKAVSRKIGKRCPDRLRQIRKKSTNPRLQKMNDSKEGDPKPKKKDDIISRLDSRACPNCGKSRAELGVTAAGMGLEGVGSRAGGLAASLRAARQARSRMFNR